MIDKNRKGFSMVEVLLVIVLISCGLLPVYSLLRSGQQRISRADTRTIATLFGASALELARTLGYDKAQRLEKDDDFIELQNMADRNGYEVFSNVTRLKVEPLPENAKELFFVKVVITVKSKRQARAGNEIPDLTFVTLITDPRYNYY